MSIRSIALISATQLTLIEILCCVVIGLPDIIGLIIIISIIFVLSLLVVRQFDYY